MIEIFKINLEPNIDYENTNFTQLKEILQNWRLNISEEIKCLSFIKNKIETDENINNSIENEIDNDENIKLDEKIIEKYSKIFNKLQELCFQEINLISESIVIIDEIINNDNNEKTEKELNKEELVYDKINLTLNNYNKIIENINKTISSIPYMLNLYILYNKIGEEENKYIRENIKNEEENYYAEQKDNINKPVKKRNISSKKEKTIYEQNIETARSKREKMVKFSKSVKNKKFKKSYLDSKININQIKLENSIKRDNLKDMTNDLEMAKNRLKNFVYNNCVKENEIKNLMKMKQENTFLNEEIINIKNSIKELQNLYEYQLEKLESLQKERNILEKENNQLIDYINKILIDEEQKGNEDKINNKNNFDNDNDNDNYNQENNDFLINKNIDNKNINENNIINITPANFESIEMFKRLNKL